MMHNGPSGVLSSCDLRIGGLTNNGNSSMVKQNQSSTRPYQHHRSDSPSSVCSLSLSPKASSPTAATSTATSTSGVASASTVTAAATDIDPQLAQHVEYELGLTRKNGTGTGTRKNAWGNLSYAELISKAITSSTDQRLTLSEIYDWMIKYVPFFRNKVDRISSAGWKNSIRHNLSLHNRFKRVQSEGNGKSSWWMINPDDKICGTNGSSTVTPGIKQTRRRLGHSVKSSSLSSVSTPKRLRAARSTKTSRVLTQRLQQQEQQQTSATQQIPPADMTTAGYDAPQWTTQSETDSSANHPYEQELYSTSGNTSTTNSTGKSLGCIPSTYHYDDVTPNYAGNTSSNNNNNAGDYSYHHGHHFHHAPPPPPPPTTQHSHPQTLYQHHHGSNYDIGSTSGYYLQRQPQSVLNDHSTNPCPLSIDTYHPNNTGSYSLQQQIESNDEHIFLRVHSTSSHSSTASLSPPTLPTNTPHLPSSSSGSSSLTYPHPHKSSLSGGYLHPTSNETLTLYSHHHHQQQQQQQQLSHHPHSHHSDIETLLQLNADDDDLDDDDDDLSTLVHHHHHHGLINDHQPLSSFYLNTTNHHHNNHPLHSHNDTSTSILRTVLKRPIVDMQNQQV